MAKIIQERLKKKYLGKNYSTMTWLRVVREGIPIHNIETDNPYVLQVIGKKGEFR